MVLIIPVKAYSQLNYNVNLRYGLEYKKQKTKNKKQKTKN